MVLIFSVFRRVVEIFLNKLQEGENGPQKFDKIFEFLRVLRYNFLSDNKLSVHVVHKIALKLADFVIISLKF